jgi:hypothetical protein
MSTIGVFARGSLVLALSLASACGGAKTSGLGDAATGSPDAGLPDATPITDAASSSDGALAYTPPPDDPCARIAAGASSSSTVAFALALSSAHASVRYFGVDSKGVTADRALASALKAADALSPMSLDGYARGLTDVCALEAKGGALPPASVAMRGDVAVVHPGAGAVTIPAAARTVAIDLRDLPESPDLEAALVSAVAASVRKNVMRADQRVRTFYGHPDEVWSQLEHVQNIYTSSVATLPGAEIAGTGDLDRTLLVLTSVVMPRAAAEIAGTLRLARRARIVGYDVLAAVAESHWSAVVNRGLAWRYKELFLDGARWPDQIAADLHADDAEAAIDQALTLDPDIAPVTSASNRASISARTVLQPDTTDPVDLGQVRAALLSAHGAIHRFWLYFAEIGDGIDGRLVDLLGSITDANARQRKDAAYALRRLSNALDDAHSFIYDWAPDGSEAPVGYFPVWLERVGDVAFVRESGMPELLPGDALVSIEGMGIAQYYDLHAQTVSAATPANRDAQVSSELISLTGPLSIEYMRAPSTQHQSLTVQPRPQQSLASIDFLRSRRHSGWLTDIGKPHVFFIQMEGTLTNPDELLASAMMARTASAVVVDMRGYPWDFNRQYSMQDLETEFHAYSIIQGPGRSGQFRTPVWTGPDQLSVDFYQVPATMDPDMITAPMALLVGPETQSSAEDFSMYLLDGRPSTIVAGRPSSGTDGNITGANELGGFGFTFTGLEVRFPDGRRFHGVGIQPSVLVTTNAADLQAGVDRDLLDAVQALGQ